jgi:FixJ family two-component response regulator
MNRTPTVFVLDHDEQARTVLLQRLRGGGYDAEGYATAHEFLVRHPDGGSGCIVCDMHIPGLDGLQLQRTLRMNGRTPAMIFLAGRDAAVPVAVRAMREGAINVLTKPPEEAMLLEAVDSALERHQIADGEAEERRRIEACLARLSRREDQVLRHIVRGALNKQVAQLLGIAEKTVKVHRAHVMQKMQVRTLAELVRLCDRVGR